MGIFEIAGRITNKITAAKLDKERFKNSIFYHRVLPFFTILVLPRISRITRSGILKKFVVPGPVLGPGPNRSVRNQPVLVRGSLVLHTVCDIICNDSKAFDGLWGEFASKLENFKHYGKLFKKIVYDFRKVFILMLAL